MDNEVIFVPVVPWQQYVASIEDIFFFFKGDFLEFFIFIYVFQHCFICRPSDSTVSEDAGIEPRTDANLALPAYLLSNRHNFTRFTRLKGL